jgi:hypothetical protein
MLFWPRSAPNGWLPQPDGIRHRNSEREYLVTGTPMGSSPVARQAGPILQRVGALRITQLFSRVGGVRWGDAYVCHASGTRRRLSRMRMLVLKRSSSTDPIIW